MTGTVLCLVQRLRQVALLEFPVTDLPGMHQRRWINGLAQGLSLWWRCHCGLPCVSFWRVLSGDWLVLHKDTILVRSLERWAGLWSDWMLAIRLLRSICLSHSVFHHVARR